MSKLLSANFARLKKNRLFWAEILFMFLFGAFLAVNQYRENRLYDYAVSLNNIFFAYAGVIGILAAVFSSLFLGTEYSDGTIRNKLIVGHSRLGIYFSNLITNIAVSFLMCLSFLASVSALGIPLMGFVKADIRIVLSLFGGTLVLAVAFCSVFTAISMICSNKAAAAVVSLLGVVLLLLYAAMVNARLEAPEFLGGYVFTDSLGNMEQETMPNPAYLTGKERAFYEFIYDFLPTGQSIQYCTMSAVHLWRLPLYSLLISLAATGIGTAVFKRKDLK